MNNLKVEKLPRNFNFIEGWYNPHRRHSSIENLSPMNYENKYINQPKNPNRKLSTKTG